MNKRIVALILAVLTLLGAAAAEESRVLSISTDSGFAITVSVPDGYRAESEAALYGAPISVTYFLPSEPSRARMTLTIAFDEEYAGRSFSDLTAAEKEQLFCAEAVDMISPAISYARTAGGTELCVLNENSEADEYVLLITLYNGYWAEVLIEKDDTSVQITEEEIETGIELMNNILSKASRTLPACFRSIHFL